MENKQEDNKHLREIIKYETWQLLVEAWRAGWVTDQYFFNMLDSFDHHAELELFRRWLEIEQ